MIGICRHTVLTSLHEKYRKMIIPFFMGFIIINLGTN